VAQFEKMRPIGGFFELEAHSRASGILYHENALALSTGRGCISYIIRAETPSKFHIPSYACASIHDPLKAQNIATAFYEIDESLEPVELPTLMPGEFFLYINYFGLKRKYIRDLFKIYGDKLIIDNTHDFFARGFQGNYSFNSARKFFGVPDGAFLYGDKCQGDKSNLARFSQSDSTPNALRLAEDYEAAYIAYQTYEKSLNCEVSLISVESEQILKAIDYDQVRKIRLANFQFMHDILGKQNTFRIDQTQDFDPFCYPFLPRTGIDIKFFHQRKFFVPSLWRDVIDRELKASVFETRLCNDLLPFPIDHRYSKDDLGQIVELVLKLL
jgi:hypothetical protein